MAHLWAGAPAPLAYTELQLCRELHCLPSQLRAECYLDVTAIVAMLNTETQVRKLRDKVKK